MSHSAFAPATARILHDPIVLSTKSIGESAMYTARKTDLGRLRKYHAELTGRYCDLLRRRRFADARAVHRLRTRVRRAILLKEEFRAAPA